MNFLKQNWFKVSIIFALFLTALIFWITEIVNNKKLDKCLELASRREIESLPRNSLGYGAEDYFNNCYKRYK